MDHLPLLTACIEHSDKDGVQWILDEELVGAAERTNSQLAVAAAAFCAETGTSDTLGFLCSENYVDVAANDWTVGRGLLVAGARAGQESIVRLLCDDLGVPAQTNGASADAFASLIAKKRVCRSPLTSAAAGGHCRIVRYLVEAKGTPVDEVDLVSRTALSYCSDQLETAVVLISLGASMAHESVAASGISPGWAEKAQGTSEDTAEQEEGEDQPVDTSMAAEEEHSAGSTCSEQEEGELAEGPATVEEKGEGKPQLAGSWDSKAVEVSKSKSHSALAISRRAKLLSLTSNKSEPSMALDVTPSRSTSAGTHSAGSQGDAAESVKNLFASLPVSAKFKRAQTGKNVLLRSDIEHAKNVLQKATQETEQARMENLGLSVEVQQLKAHVTKLRSNIAAIRKHLDRTSEASGGLPFNPSLTRAGAKRATQPAGLAARMRAAAGSDAAKRSSAVC